MFEETKAAIDKSKGRIAWFEKRAAELEFEAATLPSVGYHRAKFIEAKKALKRVRHALEDEREHLGWLLESAKHDDELAAMMSPETLASWKEFNEEQDTLRKERERREREAEKRRDAFRLIPGGRE